MNFCLRETVVPACRFHHDDADAGSQELFRELPDCRLLVGDAMLDAHWLNAHMELALADINACRCFQHTIPSPKSCTNGLPTPGQLFRTMRSSGTARRIQLVDSSGILQNRVAPYPLLPPPSMAPTWIMFYQYLA